MNREVLDATPANIIIVLVALSGPFLFWLFILFFGTLWAELVSGAPV